MNKNDFVNYVYKNNLIQRWGKKQLRKIPPDLQEDVIQEIYLLILEFEEERFNELNKQGFKHLTAFFRAFVMNSLTPTGRTRNLINLFGKEDPTDFSTYNLNDNDNEE